ncbi:MAG TPA: MlaD family protein, partial [Actinomycetota bacterium]|nr:MlaD family protein [Actinomycetota bacterium]
MKSFRERRAWIVGLISIVLIAVGVGLAFSLNRFEGLRGVYSIAADLEDAAGVRSGNEVRVAGVKIGTVTGVELIEDAARVEMEIQDDIDLPRETRVEVKLKTLLGQKFIALRLPEAYLSAASDGGDPRDATAGFLADGDVIPGSQTTIPFEIYQAASEGTAALEGIDKASLRKMIRVLDRTIGTSKEEFRRALSSINAAGEVLEPKGGDIAKLLRNAQKVTGTLAAGDQDLEGILLRSEEVLGTLAERRATISTLLAATSDLTENLGLLIQAARGSIETGVTDLNSILVLAQGELDTIEVALEELGVSQEMFGKTFSFGRFVEGHACAVTTEDTCVPKGSAEDP